MADFKRYRIGSPIAVDLASSPSPTNFVIDASTDRAEWIVQAPEAATITHLGFRYGLRTGTPVQHKISIQGVTTSTGGGIPDGTIKGGGTPASGLFTPPASTAWDGTMQWVALDNSYAVARGEFIAIVIEPVGTPDVSNMGSFTVAYSGPPNARQALPYAISNNAGSRTRSLNQPVYGYKSASKVYGTLYQSFTQSTYSVETAGADEWAMWFQLDSGYGDTFRVVGLRALIQTPAATKSLLVNLYSGTTVLQNITWDTDVVVAVGSVNRNFEIYFDETSLTDLSFGTEYRLGFAPQDTSSAFALTAMYVSTAAELAPYPGGGDIYISKRVDSGAWTDETNGRLLVDLIIDDWTEPAGGGGGGTGISRGRQIG